MKKLLFLFCLFALSIAPANAQVRVAKSADRKISIDLSRLRVAADSGSRMFFQTLENNLRRSGWFEISRKSGEIRLNGSVDPTGGKTKVTVQAIRPADRARLLSKVYSLESSRSRALAHRVSDDLVAALTGHKGIASTKIALVGTRSGAKELWLCDADGKGLRQLTSDRSIIVGPTWGPAGNNLFYTSFMRGFPDVYRIDLNRSKRYGIASYGGLNTGAAISPDGKTMALILSKDGNPELYVQTLSGGAPQRLTRTLRTTEASPCWSPDGRQIVFVSDQSGTPQLYLIGRNGGSPQRLSRRGSENVAPDWGPNNLIACSSRERGRYNIALINPSTEETRYLPNDGANYESPSWAPDGRHLAATRTVQHQSALYLLDTVNDPPVALVSRGGDWLSPAWSPR